MSPGYIEHFEQLTIYVLLYCSTGLLRGLWVQVDGEDTVTDYYLDCPILIQISNTL